MTIKFRALIGGPEESRVLTPVKVTLHFSDNPAGRKVSEEKLYRHAGTGLHPDGDHHEMELSDETVKMFQVPNPIIHAVQAEDGRFFVCYPNKVETEDEAGRIFCIWALGTVVSMMRQEDVLRRHFNPNMSFENFAQIILEEYGVRMTDLEVHHHYLH